MSLLFRQLWPKESILYQTITSAYKAHAVLASRRSWLNNMHTCLLCSRAIHLQTLKTHHYKIWNILLTICTLYFFLMVLIFLVDYLATMTFLLKISRREVAVIAALTFTYVKHVVPGQNTISIFLHIYTIIWWCTCGKNIKLPKDIDI